VTDASRDVPQFQTAEFHEQPAGDACRICHKPIGGTHYRINGAMVCPACSERVRAQKPRDTPAAFSRAVLFGLGGALVGLALYAAVGILLHLEIGFVSLAVGYLVGTAMMKGSGNIGGRRYQWAAVALTYVAVSLSAVPIGIAHYSHVMNQASQVRSGDADGSERAAATPTRQSKLTPEKLGRLVGVLALYGLASPFLGLMHSPFGGLMGMIILLVGVRVAWQITAGPRIPSVSGPY
jgi:hypothetical protein